MIGDKAKTLDMDNLSVVCLTTDSPVFMAWGASPDSSALGKQIIDWLIIIMLHIKTTPTDKQVKLSASFQSARACFRDAWYRSCMVK